MSITTINNQLKKHNLESFQHRLISRLCNFAFTIKYSKSSPRILNSMLSDAVYDNKLHNLRDSSKFLISTQVIHNCHGEHTFNNFFANLINKCSTLKELFSQFNCYSLLKEFNKRFNSKIDQIVDQTLQIFPKFKYNNNLRFFFLKLQNYFLYNLFFLFFFYYYSQTLIICIGYAF